MQGDRPVALLCVSWVAEVEPVLCASKIAEVEPVAPLCASEIAGGWIHSVSEALRISHAGTQVLQAQHSVPVFLSFFGLATSALGSTGLLCKSPLSLPSSPMAETPGSCSFLSNREHRHLKRMGLHIPWSSSLTHFPPDTQSGLFRERQWGIQQELLICRHTETCCPTVVNVNS